MFTRGSFAALIATGMFIAVAVVGCGSTPHHHSRSSSNASPSGTPFPVAAHLKAGKLLILVPASLKAKSTIHSSSAAGTYSVTVLTNAGMKVSFGGQYYASRAKVRQQLTNSVIVSPGTGIPDPLGFGVFGHKYPQQRLITWTSSHWIIEVSGVPGTPLSALQSPARTIVKLFKQVGAPTTSQGIVHWTVARKGAQSITMAWARGSAIYHIVELHDSNAEVAMEMASSMVPVP